MLAKRLVPCLPVSPGSNPNWDGLAQDLTKRAQSLEDDGADEILLNFEEDLHALTDGALRAVRSVTRELSVTVLARGGSCSQGLEALIEAAHGMAEVKRYLAAAGIVVRGVS